MAYIRAAWQYALNNGWSATPVPVYALQNCRRYHIERTKNVMPVN